MALLVPPLAGRSPHQQAHVVVLVSLTGAGLGGLLLAPTSAPVLWAVLVGAGLGGNFPLALTLIVLRARTTATTAALSGMAQSIGFTVAAGGPLLVGLLHEASGSWAPGLTMLLVVGVAQVGVGVLAGRDLAVDDH